MFRFQLNLSSSVHGVTQLDPECVLELLKLSSDVNECKPLPLFHCGEVQPTLGGDAARHSDPGRGHRPASHGVGLPHHPFAVSHTRCSLT